jgi:hypothetical protein
MRVKNVQMSRRNRYKGAIVVVHLYNYELLEKCEEGKVAFLYFQDCVGRTERRWSR